MDLPLRRPAVWLRKNSKVGEEWPRCNTKKQSASVSLHCTRLR